MKIEILVSTMGMENPISLAKLMNVSSDVLICNQNDTLRIDQDEANGYSARAITTNQVGLSKSRNVLIENMRGEICLIADDDIIYNSRYKETINEAFLKYPNADVIIFNLENMGKRYVIKHDFLVNSLNYQRFGSVRIAFKSESILKSNIKFHNYFGSGAFFSSGEDTLFLKNCLENSLTIIAVSMEIGELTEDRESTWFSGYNRKYFFDKGALFKAMYPKTFLFWNLQFSMRKSKLSKEYNMIEIFNIMCDGSKAFSEGFYLDGNELRKINERSYR